MLIPQGDWIVVSRNVRDNKSKGTIIKVGLKESTAKTFARDYTQHSKQCNYWAMHKSDY